MTPVEFEESVRSIRSQHMQLQAQLRVAESEVERAEIQRKMDAVMAEFRVLQRVPLADDKPAVDD